MAHEVTSEKREFIASLVGAGATNEQIISLLGVSKPTFYKHYADTVRYGRELLAQRRAIQTVSVVEKLYSLAMEGDRKACTEWMDRLGGEELKLRKQVEHTGEVKFRPILEIRSAPTHLLDAGSKLKAPPLAATILETEEEGIEDVEVEYEADTD